MKALKALVIIMAVLIAAGLTVLVILVVKGVGPDTSQGPLPSTAGAPRVPLAGAPAATSGFGETGINLPPGAKIVETSTGDGRIVLRIRQADGAQALLLIDAATGRRLGLVRLEAGDTPGK